MIGPVGGGGDPAQRVAGAGVHVGAAIRLFVDDFGEQRRLGLGIACGLEAAADSTVERQDDDAVVGRPLHQHLARLLGREEKAHGGLQLLLAVALHGAGKIETERAQRRLAQRPLIEVERLPDHRRFRQANRRHDARRIEVPVGLGGCRDRVGREWQAPAGGGDLFLHLARLQVGEQFGEELLRRRSLAVVDEAQRRIGHRHAVGGVDGVERLLGERPQPVVGLLEHRLVVPHRIVAGARPGGFDIEVGQPAGRARRSGDAAQQGLHRAAHRGIIEIARLDHRLAAQRARQHGEVSAGAGVGLRRRSHEEAEALVFHRREDIGHQHILADPAQFRRFRLPHAEDHRHLGDRRQVLDLPTGIEQVDPDARGRPHRIGSDALGTLEGEADVERAFVTERAGGVALLAEGLDERLQHRVLRSGGEAEALQRAAIAARQSKGDERQCRDGEGFQHRHRPGASRRLPRRELAALPAIGRSSRLSRLCRTSPNIPSGV